MTHVVDTSVILKWVVHEDDSALARAWAGTALTAPDLIEAELANALWKKVRRGEIDPRQALRAFLEAPEALVIVPALPLLEQALPMAFGLNHPVCDCVFLALADRLQLRLLTADKRLVKACAGTRFQNMLRPLHEEI